MSKNNNLSERREAVLERMEGFGSGKLHGPNNDKEQRIREARVRLGIIDPATDRLTTVRSERSRKHGRRAIEDYEDSRRTRIGKGLGSLAAGTVAVALLGAGLGNVADDEYVPPHPGNMQEFSDDENQIPYSNNPDDFMIQGGKIVPKQQLIDAQALLNNPDNSTTQP
jgi:hypothetical protein